MHTLKSQACNGEANETNLTKVEFIKNVTTPTNKNYILTMSQPAFGSQPAFKSNT